MKKLSSSLLALMVLFALCVATVTNVYAQEVGASSVEFPYTGNRTAVWIVAQLHILFAAFILDQRHLFAVGRRTPDIAAHRA